MIRQSHSDAQFQGYVDALGDHGIPFNKNLVVQATGHYYRAGMGAAQALMQRCPEISAIACYYDLMAFGVIRGLLDLGYRVPDDVSVIGYDNMQFTEASYPRLTTVETPSQLMAEKACELLISRLEASGKKQNTAGSNFSNIILEPKLIIRESVRTIPDAKDTEKKETNL